MITITLIFVSILLFAFVFSPHAQGCGKALADLLGRVRASGSEIFSPLHTSLRDWLDQERYPPPQKAVPAVLIFLIACSLARADFFILLSSLSLIFPFANGVEVLAFVLVAIGCVIGFLCHALENRAARIALTFLAAIIIALQSILAYERVSITKREELLRVEKIAPSNKGSLILNGGNLFPSTEPPSATSEKPAPGAKPLPDVPPWDFEAILAALYAMLCSFGSMLAFWGAFKLGLGALVWVMTLPLRLLTAIPFYLFRWFDHCRFEESLSVYLEGFLKYCREIRASVSHSIRASILYWSPAQRHQRALEKIARESEVAQKSASEDMILFTLQSVATEANREVESKSALKAIERDTQRQAAQHSSRYLLWTLARVFSIPQRIEVHSISSFANRAAPPERVSRFRRFLQSIKTGKSGLAKLRSPFSSSTLPNQKGETL